MPDIPPRGITTGPLEILWLRVAVLPLSRAVSPEGRAM